MDRVVRAGVREIVARHTLAEVLTDQAQRDHGGDSREGGRFLFGHWNLRFMMFVSTGRSFRTAIEKNVHARMKADRDRLARKFRAEGEEQARKIRASADRDAKVIVANAKGEAQVTRGEGDAESTRIYAAAYGKAPEFYAFVRSLEAYRKTIGEGTTLILSPESEFFEFLGESGSSADRR